MCICAYIVGKWDPITRAHSRVNRDAFQVWINEPEAVHLWSDQLVRMWKPKCEQPQCLTKGDLRPVSDIKQCTQAHNQVYMGNAVPKCSSQGLNAQVARRLNQYRNQIEVVGKCVVSQSAHTTATAAKCSASYFLQGAVLMWDHDKEVFVWSFL